MNKDFNFTDANHLYVIFRSCNNVQRLPKYINGVKFRGRWKYLLLQSLTDIIDYGVFHKMKRGLEKWDHVEVLYKQKRFTVQKEIPGPGVAKESFIPQGVTSKYYDFLKTRKVQQQEQQFSTGGPSSLVFCFRDPSDDEDDDDTENECGGDSCGESSITQMANEMYDNEKDVLRYRLVFGFTLTKDQEARADQFIRNTLGDQYSLWNLYRNIVTRKFLCFGRNHSCCLVRMKNEWDFPPLPNKKRSWDCVSLMMRMLSEVGLFKVDHPVPLLGLSAFDAGDVMLKLYKTQKLVNCTLVISKELDPEHHEEGLKMFYSYISPETVY
jgi:hypothetical protein